MSAPGVKRTMAGGELSLVAQAFQPVRINEADGDARPPYFHNLRMSRRLMSEYAKI
jgi:hypothetical protein